jgi:peptide/nickel transport system substrate-binding protein
MRFWASVLFSVLLAAPPAARAAVPGDCGTVVIPPGLGVGPGADVTSLNPLLVTSLYNAEAIGLIYESLLWINRYHKIDFSRSIASAVNTPDAGKTYNVTLRPWHWSDGVPVTTKDVLYTFKLIKAFGTNYAGYGTGGMPDIVQSLTASDDEHFTVVLKRRVNPDWFILSGLGQLSPLPAHVWNRYTTDEIWQAQSDPAFFSVVDGPLRLEKLVTGVDAQFTPNPEYEGEPMHFSRFILKFQNSEAQELQGMESGDLDMSNLPFALIAQASHLPGNHVVVLPPTYSWHELIPNIANPATPYFADARVRQALADGINQQEIIDLAMHGHGMAVHGPVPPVPDTFLSPSAKAGDYPTGYNPAKARALLAQAGFTPGPKGILQKNGRDLVFTLQIPAAQPLRLEMAETIQQNLRGIGIAMSVRQVEFNTMLSEMLHQPAAWDAILIGENLAAYPSGEELFVKGGYLNNNGYSDPKMDALVKQSTDAPGLDGLFAYEDYAAAQQPVIFLPNERYSILVRNGMHGVEDFINPLGAWAPEKLWCSSP